MNAKLHRQCFGMLPPDFERPNYDKPTKGRAFRVFVGKNGVGAQRRRLTVRPEVCDECVDCPELRQRCGLSMAKLALPEALRNC